MALAADAAATQHLDPQQQACLENELAHTKRGQLIDALSGTQDAITQVEQAARAACAITTPT